MTSITEYEKRGYLTSEFRLFHLLDINRKEFEFHYHDFDKIVIFIKGEVIYTIEGRAYQLKPYDIVLVHHNEIHRPIINKTLPYERIIVYISPDFIEKYHTKEYDLSDCFQRAKKEKTNVLRIPSLEKSILYESIVKLEHSFSEEEYAAPLYQQVLFLEFMIYLNRAVKNNSLDYTTTKIGNQKIIDIITYINENLTKELSIDLLSSQFFISKYHLMHLFKKETGYTIGNYITFKRLLSAKEKIKEGGNITEICYQCGFYNYSTFSRAFKKLFGKTAKEYKKSVDKSYLVSYNEYRC